MNWSKKINEMSAELSIDHEILQEGYDMLKNGKPRTKKRADGYLETDGF